MGLAAPVCDCCEETVAEVTHVERTGGPDGELCDDCIKAYDEADREPVQY